MKHAFRVATAAAAIAASASVAGTCRAAATAELRQDISSQFDAANSFETVRHLAVDIGPRRSGTPEEDEAAEYLKQALDGSASRPRSTSTRSAGNALRRPRSRRRTPRCTTVRTGSELADEPG